MKVFVIASVVAFLAVVGCTWAAPSLQDNRVDSDFGGSSWALAARYLGTCLDSDDMTTCLAVKGITAMNRAARSNNIELLNGVSFKRDPTATARSAKALTETDVYSQLPEIAEERSGRLIDLAMESAADFLGTHNLEVKIPTEATQEVARALDEGRGKLKKMMGPLALAIGAKLFAVVPLLIGGLALLTFKAVFVAKIALVMALLLGGSRIFSGFGNKFGGALNGGYSNAGWNQGSTGGGWTSGASSAYPYARSIQNEDTDAQELAYAGQAPVEAE